MKCSVEGCSGPVVARTWCSKHYQRWQAHGDPRKVLRNKGHDGVCGLPGCEGAYKSKGLCVKHYARWRKHGDVGVVLVNNAHSGRCSVRGCDGKYYAREMCASHYRQAYPYGLDVEWFAENPICAVCGADEDLSYKLTVDHDHVTGKVRGRLCHSCNVSIGHLKDSPALLRKAATYLEDHSK